MKGVGIMTDNEKLDLILEKLGALEGEITQIKSEVAEIKGEVSEIKGKMATKRQLMESTAKLKAMDEMVLDEVERVHGILDMHKADKTVHTA